MSAGIDSQRSPPVPAACPVNAGKAHIAPASALAAIQAARRSSDPLPSDAARAKANSATGAPAAASRQLRPQSVPSSTAASSVQYISGSRKSRSCRQNTSPTPATSAVEPMSPTLRAAAIRVCRRRPRTRGAMSQRLDAAPHVVMSPAKSNQPTRASAIAGMSRSASMEPEP